MRREITFEAEDGTRAVVVIEGTEVRFVHDDDVADALEEIGKREVRRASNVEPALDGWVADMSAVGGPVFTGPRRSQLIKQEVQWLAEHGVPFPTR